MKTRGVYSTFQRGRLRLPRWHDPGVITAPPRQREVAGTIELETEEPIVVHAPGGLRERLAELRERHPWLIPALAAGLAFAVIAARRR